MTVRADDRPVAVQPAVAPAPGARRVLALLLLVYILNFVDRQVLGILARPIQADLGLSRTEFGAIGGLAFALLYATAGVPLGLLADKVGRSRVIAASLAVWSGFTALCGAASGFWSLFWCRLGVGVGEAGGTAPSYALIAEYFPPGQRARALATYALGAPIGLAAGTLLGGAIAAAVNWRAAFVVLGLIGLIVSPLFARAVRDLPRVSTSPPPRGALALLVRKPSFWLLAFGASCASLVGYGLALWLPSVLMGANGFDLVGVSMFTGALFLVGGCAGVLAGGWMADRMGRAAHAWVPGVSFLIAAPLYAAGMSTGSSVVSFAALLVPSGLALVWLGTVTAAVQHLVPAQMRATASASFLLVTNLIGLGGGPLLMGHIADRLAYSLGDDALRWAALYVLGFYPIAAVLMLVAARTLSRDWMD
ncbi:Sugar phosphate permease [Sphingomonas gellani]|uniref:Sugar phosphate permease n=1 Tax=Sphingomonas gellani TaxID=1166340 RepID=A0A1H8CGH0_9SPHN|nr:MFS transporter [Sphingomonas gellani]SEM94090.1 Sugar phosphate permease [Sphingomonas gellani]